MEFSQCPSFLQSPEWEQFQQSVGRRTWRIDDILVIEHPLGFGLRFLYCPRPMFENAEQEREFFDGAARLGKTDRAIFLKIDPVQKLQTTNYKLKTTSSVQPRITTVLDLAQSAEKLLARMHPKTRYNIRLAEKKWVKVRATRYEVRGTNSDIHSFSALLEETARRDGFRTHPSVYYEKLLSIRSVEFTNELFLAEHEGKILAGALVNFYAPSSGKGERPSGAHRRVATYLHGASSNEARNVMAPYLLHWGIIQEARQRGYHYYDFWGIDETKWPGITRFKTGFGGQTVEYPETVDVVYRPTLYAVYRGLKQLRVSITRVKSSPS